MAPLLWCSMIVGISDKATFWGKFWSHIIVAIAISTTPSPLLLVHSGINREVDSSKTDQDKVLAVFSFFSRSRFQHNEKRPRHFGCPNSDSVCPNSDKIYLTILTCSSSLGFFSFLIRIATHLSLPILCIRGLPSFGFPPWRWVENDSSACLAAQNESTDIHPTSTTTATNMLFHSIYSILPRGMGQHNIVFIFIIFSGNNSNKEE